jgi:hypothetical protein
MVAVTITEVFRTRTRPPTRPAGRETRAVYVRRRITAALLGIALVLATAEAGGALGSSTLAAPDRRPADPPHVIVRPGDSLWSLARRFAPGEDPRPVVDALAEARHGAPLLPGERVEWPK